MTTATSKSSAPMAFPKYPELPPELRLRIIKETLDSFTPRNPYSRAKDGPNMSRYACIDREWNRVVELRLFKNIELSQRDGTWADGNVPEELVDFGAICGKRSGRLSRVRLVIHDAVWTTFGRQPYLETILQLFNLMKDWGHQSREQQGLIELILTFNCTENWTYPMLDGPDDVGKFPQVPVIGSIHEPVPRSYSVHLHPSVSASLYQKLPNIHHASLTLPSAPSEDISIQNMIDAMDSLRVEKPGVTHLDLRFPFDRLHWRPTQSTTMMPVIQSLNASPSPWSDRLVSLEIHHDIVVHDFLRHASDTMWPNLKRIKLVGAIDIRPSNTWREMDEEDATAVAGEAGRSIIGALTTVLPSMPKVTDVQIGLFFNTLNVKSNAFQANIHLGNMARTEKADQLLHCGDKFMPDSNNGVAQLGGICHPGDLAVQLQDAVWRHRRQELEVCDCTKDGYYYDRKPRRPCAEWNRRTASWHTVFKNDLDIFIYEMGQFWEDLDGAW